MKQELIGSYNGWSRIQTGHYFVGLRMAGIGFEWGRNNYPSSSNYPLHNYPARG